MNAVFTIKLGSRSFIPTIAIYCRARICKPNTCDAVH